MALTDYHDQDGGYGAVPPGAQSQPELKAILDVISGQIADAERRQTELVRNIEQRISHLDQDNRVLKQRTAVPLNAVPLNEAYERIEQSLPRVSAPVAPAAEPAPQPQRHRTGAASLDALTASLPGDVSQPWDNTSASALANLYEGDGDVTRGPDLLEAELRFEASNAINSGSAPATVKTQIDSSWFERRFAEITRHIETVVGQIKPDHTVLELSQRFDELEQRFGARFEDLATRADVDDLRLIGGHMAELVGYLESAQTQLNRLDGIEAQVLQVADHLKNGMAASDGASHGIKQTDIDAFAAAAAERIAARLPEGAQDSGNSGMSELRASVDQLISDARQSEENTTALLDTLQQAMIRLLDRVDSLESGIEKRSYDVSPKIQDRSTAVPATTEAADSRSQAIEQAVAAVAANQQSKSSVSYGSDNDAATPGTRKPRAKAASSEHDDASQQNNRQDLIAEARRARVKLAQESRSYRPAATSAPASPAPGSMASLRESVLSVPKGMAVEQPQKRSGKLVVMALAATVLLGVSGLWLSSGGPAVEQSVQPAALSAPAANDAPSAAVVPAAADASVTAIDGAESAGEAASMETGAADAATAQDSEAGAVAGEADVPANSDQAVPSSDEPADTGASDVQGNAQEPSSLSQPAITPSTVSMTGIAIEMPEDTSSGDGITKAQRTQAIAKMSNSLGVAASRTKPTMAMPRFAALQPDDGEVPQAQTAPDNTTASIANSPANGVSAMSLPPAAIGPTSLRVAAAKGDPSAEFEVGARFAEGRGVSQSFQDAARWYQKSASRGFAQAQYRLGTLYERGLGVSPDPARAKVWYEQAAQQGNIKAMHNLAVLSANREGSAPDYETAGRWFASAADFGLPDSQFNLAVLYENGLGVEKDMQQAYKWLVIAARSNDAEAKRRRDVLKTKLSAQELANAEKLARSWRPKAGNSMINDARVAGDAWKRSAESASAAAFPVAPESLEF